MAPGVGVPAVLATWALLAPSEHAEKQIVARIIAIMARFTHDVTPCARVGFSLNPSRLGYNHRPHGEHPVGKKARARLTAKAQSQPRNSFGRQDARLSRAPPGDSRCREPDQRGRSAGDQLA